MAYARRHKLLVYIAAVCSSTLLVLMLQVFADVHR